MTTDRPEWDHPSPNAGCQQGHPLIEFQSADQAKDCPMCAALNRTRELETAIREIHVIAAEIEDAEIMAICHSMGSRLQRAV